MYHYQWNEWALFFFIYCFVGWIWESCYVSVKEKHWVNRGFLRMPLLPIYGYGALIMLFASLPFQGNYILMYLAGTLSATTLEFATGWCMERLFKVKYWDYTPQKFNLCGYICLKSSIAWGFFTLLLVEVIHPPVERLVTNYLDSGLGYGILIVVGSMYLVDSVWSIRTALDVAKALEKLSVLRAEMEHVQVQFNLMKAELRDHVGEYGEELSDKWNSIPAVRELNATRIAIKEGTENIYKGIYERVGRPFLHAMLRNNPGATSKKFAAEFTALKKRVTSKIKPDR